MYIYKNILQYVSTLLIDSIIMSIKKIYITFKAPKCLYNYFAEEKDASNT